MTESVPATQMVDEIWPTMDGKSFGTQFSRTPRLSTCYHREVDAQDLLVSFSSWPTFPGVHHQCFVAAEGRCYRPGSVVVRTLLIGILVSETSAGKIRRKSSRTSRYRRMDQTPKFAVVHTQPPNDSGISEVADAEQGVDGSDEAMTDASHFVICSSTK